MLEKQLEIMRQPRVSILKTLEEFTLDQLNVIPAGFNNNIIWNLGHMVATLQKVCYLKAGLDDMIEESFYKRYESGSKPEAPADEQEYQLIKTLFMTSLDKLGEDYKAGIFGNYPEWTTRYGATVGNIDEALAFLPFHEGLHIGYIMAMRKLV